MPRPAPLTDVQKNRLRKLEPALRNAVHLGEYEKAKVIVADLQTVLRTTGHETRLMQAKNWLFEAAMEAGELSIAIAGFQGVRQKVSDGTRIHLEATALLAICHLRRRDISSAEPLMAQVLKDQKVITSESKRRQFRLRIINRFEEEAVLSAIAGGAHERLDVEKIQDAAGVVVQTQNEDEILMNIGREVPPEAISVLLRVHEFVGRQLSASELKLLPAARSLTEKVSIGRTVYNATKRVAWRSLCDPESAVYKMWCTNGMMAVIDKKSLTVAVAAALSGWKIGAYALAVSLVAMVMKMGLEVFCEISKPQGVMIHTSEKS